MTKIEKTALTVIYIQRIFIVFLIYLMHTVLYGYVSVYHINDNYNLFTDLDKIFPFVPEMVYLYMSFYAVIVLSVFSIKTEEAFNRIIASIIGTMLFTYPLFYFFPAYYPIPFFEANTFTTKFLQWCFIADVPNNTFPSLHVGLSFTMAFGIRHYNKKLGILYLIWATGIALSTIMIRKHFVIDSFSGIIMAALTYNLFVLGKTTKPLFKTIYKLKVYFATLLESKSLVKHFNQNIISIIIIILKMK